MDKSEVIEQARILPPVSGQPSVLHLGLVQFDHWYEQCCLRGHIDPSVTEWLSFVSSSEAWGRGGFNPGNTYVAAAHYVGWFKCLEVIKYKEDKASE